mgnify:CR=1 FL=1
MKTAKLSIFAFIYATVLSGCTEGNDAKHNTTKASVISPEATQTAESKQKDLMDKIRKERIEKQEKIKEFQRQQILKKLEGIDLSAKRHLAQHGEDFQSIANERCVTVEEIIADNPRLKLDNNRIVAPFAGLVLSLPDHACSDVLSPGFFDGPPSKTKPTPLDSYQ